MIQKCVAERLTNVVVAITIVEDAIPIQQEDDGRDGSMTSPWRRRGSNQWSKKAQRMASSFYESPKGLQWSKTPSQSSKKTMEMVAWRHLELHFEQQHMGSNLFILTKVHVYIFKPF